MFQVFQMGCYVSFLLLFPLFLFFILSPSSVEGKEGGGWRGKKTPPTRMLGSAPCSSLSASSVVSRLLLPPFTTCLCRCRTCGREGTIWDPVLHPDERTDWVRTSLVSESSSCGSYLRYAWGRVYKRREGRDRPLLDSPLSKDSPREVSLFLILLVSVSSLPLRAWKSLVSSSSLPLPYRRGSFVLPPFLRPPERFAFPFCQTNKQKGERIEKKE